MTVNENEVEVEQVIELTEEAVPEITQTEEVDLSAILDGVLKELEDSQPVGPNIQEVQSSENEVLLQELQKQLEEKTQEQNSVIEEKDKLFSELEEIKTKLELSAEEAETYKKDLEMVEEFYEKLQAVPVLGELVKIALDKGPEAINIPKYLKDLQESRIMAQSVSPKTEAVKETVDVPKISSFEQAILRRNKR